ncbi:hypothetical protein EX227_01020 [Providencia rettgeri]|uniref:Integrase n=1 Tax=Providencia rettgeri TaxID=587 RepID=A0AAP2K015_PRORE|nr:hypothetical protein [Providencia rettgeri]MBX6950356.1 hypothetical protein [Providencia rettgeri]MBX6954208.1 hypothetical protein [Providencia rettgeri]MBX6960786.1 hypothetical protein [Providencia rettgeri]MBX6973250.1 hypothetical protein [Providencia rettgeri]MBX6981384.1 hypothetical protein [Providencia rettgeri]
MHEKGFNLAWVETLLTHIDKNGMYNHVQYVDRHREMMQRYADYMDELERGLDNVISVNF